jgi:hypothetical protein
MCYVLYVGSDSGSGVRLPHVHLFGHSTCSMIAQEACVRSADIVTSLHGAHA